MSRPETKRPEFSPDGRWLAYGSNKSGRFEVYVRPYPGPEPAEQVSIDGGMSPAWNLNGRELSFLTLSDQHLCQKMQAVEFAAGSPPRIGNPHTLFEFDRTDLMLNCAPVRCHDVAPDGQRFYTTQAVPAPPAPPVTHVSVILNWVEEPKAKVPAK